MKKIFLSAIFILSIFSCKKENEILNIDILRLKTALLNYDKEAAMKEITKKTGLLKPHITTNDQYGHINNFNKIIGEINSCKGLTAESICYACIKTNPPQSEMLISIDSSGYMAYRVVDYTSSSDTTLYIANIHQYN